MFTAGLALVLVPITLGISLIAATIANYHTALYWVGGLFMLALAGLSLSGRMLSLPSFLKAPDTSRGDTAAFFGLGVFSGVASSCCAPVLAGVMTLSALSGSPAGGIALGLAYTFGMVFPLFVMALLWDRYHLGERRFWRARPVRARIGGRTLATNTVNLAVAVMFAVMGTFVIGLAYSGQMTGGPGFQVAIGDELAVAFAWITDVTAGVPDPLLGLAVLALVGVFVVATLRDRRSGDGVPGDGVPGDGVPGDGVPGDGHAGDGDAGDGDGQTTTGDTADADAINTLRTKNVGTPR